MSDMQVLSSLRNGGLFNRNFNLTVEKPRKTLDEGDVSLQALSPNKIDTRSVNTLTSGEGFPAPATGCDGKQGTASSERLMVMMETNFSKLEGMISLITKGMSDLNGEVNNIKSKLQDAKLL